MTDTVDYPARCKFCGHDITVPKPQGETLTQKDLDGIECKGCGKKGTFRGMPF